MHRGVVGVGLLNETLQEALNPASENVAQRQMGNRAFRAGDRVMQIRNNYDKDVYNGDMGVVTAVDLEMQKLTVMMDGRAVPYDFLELDELVHSLRRQRPQKPRVRVSGGRHSCLDQPLYDAPAQPALHRHHTGAAIGGFGRAAACDCDGGTQ